MSALTVATPHSYGPSQAGANPLSIVDLRGAKKGEATARQPVETPDSLRSIARARILDLISEGEIRGLVDGNRSIFLDGVPIEGPGGVLNFQGVRVELRSGTQDQSHIPGFPSVENEIGVGVELRTDTPVVRTVSGSELSAIRVRFGVPTLQKLNTENGDTEGYSVGYAIDLSTDGSTSSTVLSNAFTGKTTTLYQRSHRIDLPAGQSWQIRVRRLTPNANSNTVGDTVNVESITEVIDAKLRYPNCALAAVEVDASQFQTKPSTAYQIWGRIVQVPSNYDVATRTYNGIWDGTFKPSWTNNPAWIFYDLVVNDRFGLGHRIPAAWVDRWRLYQIAQYCDQLVSDGMGGREPRFVSSVYMQTRGDAYKVLQDMASMFRGVSFYAAGQMMASCDMPQDPIFTYTAANVVDGKFGYEGTSLKARHTVALVSWSDPDDFGRQKVETVVHREGVARYGINQIEVTAIGCHSRSQAQRVGNHILWTEYLATETISFVVGLEGMICQPGDVFQVANKYRAGRRNAGRIRGATLDTLTLDALPPAIGPGDTLRATLPTGRTEARTVAQVTGNTVRVIAPWSAVPVKHSIWCVESADLALQQFRAVSITEETPTTFRITGIHHVPQKFAAIDDGTRLELPPISIIPPSVQPPPASVALTSRSVIDQGIASHILNIAWERADKAIAYDVEWRRDDLDWVRAGRVATASLDVPGIYAGRYLARVRAINALGVASMPKLSPLTDIAGKTTPPPALTSLAVASIVFGIDLAWGFPQGATDTAKTEIWYSPADDLENAIKLGDFAYPQARHSMMGLAAGARFFFWGRLVDRSGNIGPWYPASRGVMGEASTNAQAILDYLVGKITMTELAQELQREIESIQSLVPLLWSADATYAAGQTVVFEGRIYLWTGEEAGNETPPADPWRDIGGVLQEAGAIVGRLDSFEQSITELEGQVTAQGKKVDGLFARLDVIGAGDAVGGAGDAHFYAGTMTIQSVITQGDLAQAIRLDQVSAGLTQGLTEVSASVQRESSARVEADQALARDVTTVQAKLGDTQAAVQQTSEALVGLDGRVKAAYSVKAQINADGRIYAAGMGLGVEQLPDGSYQSQFLVQADRFALLNVSNGVTSTPFVIQGGQTFINQAFIGDAWITNAKIANGAIDNAKIGNFIQSDNYVPGQTGWRIDKSGAMEINGMTPDGYRVRMVNTGLYLYYPNGNLAIELGALA
ncbi:host specificity protein J [Stenotrophomonas sp. P5_B8]